MHAGNSIYPAAAMAAVVLLVWVGVILLRLLSLQVFHHDDLVRLAPAATAKDRGDCRPCAAPSSIAPASRWRKRCPPNRSASIRMKIPDAGVAADLLSRVLDLERDAAV